VTDKTKIQIGEKIYALTPMGIAERERVQRLSGESLKFVAEHPGAQTPKAWTDALLEIVHASIERAQSAPTIEEIRSQWGPQDLVDAFLQLSALSAGPLAATGKIKIN
jgi:hypothetical protein